MNAVVSTHNLTKRFGRVLAVDGLDLEVHQGEVYGLLGPNGAGKTTTLRMLVGLVRPTAGRAEVLGRPPAEPAALFRIGALVEEPSFYPYLSGRDNLRVLARYGGVDPRRADALLGRVGLSARAQSKVKTYSLGMRQRLAVAAALLKDPELLVLDEPANGLDPHGVVEMRELIRSLRDEGRTVLLSSHLLAEVEQVCTRVGVIHRGRLVAQGRLEELRGAARLAAVAEPLDQAERVCRGFPGVTAVTVTSGRLEVSLPADRVGELNAALVAAGIQVRELRRMEQSLESIFLELTGGGGS